MKPSEMARIGDHLKSFREKINLSQTEFADKCKINVVQYRRYENNSSIPREEQLNKIINTFTECGLEITKFDLIFKRPPVGGVDRDGEVDKISLQYAIESPFWLALLATEPERKVNVEMSYSDLQIICDLIERERIRREKNV